MLTNFHILNILQCLLFLISVLRDIEAYNSYALEDGQVKNEVLTSLGQVDPTGYPFVNEADAFLSPDEETIKKKAPSNAEELAIAAGYSLESYQTTTADGYHLVIHRLLEAKETLLHRDGELQKPVVLLQHGISQSSGDWLINDSGKSLAMVLVDSGYDVWLGNFRGNRYSNSHVSKDQNTMEYYNFTFHEMGVYDFPVTVDLVLKETNQSQLNYVGCSLGATTFFSSMSEHPEYAKKIRFMGALSPQVFLSHTRTPIKILAPHLSEIKDAAVRLKVMRINPETLPILINSQLGKLCFWRKLSRGLCNSIYKMLDEFGLRRIEEEHLDDLWKYIPSTTSARTCIHLLQLMNNQDELFDEYDYGPDGNTKLYGTPAPPEYDLAHVRVPVALFTGKEELFSTLEDVEALKKALPHVVHHVEVDSTFRVHTDFTHESKAMDQIFKPLVSILNIYNIGKIAESQ